MERGGSVSLAQERLRRGQVGTQPTISELRREDPEMDILPHSATVVFLSSIRQGIDSHFEQLRGELLDFRGAVHEQRQIENVRPIVQRHRRRQREVRDTNDTMRDDAAATGRFLLGMFMAMAFAIESTR